MTTVRIHRSKDRPIPYWPKYRDMGFPAAIVLSYALEQTGPDNEAILPIDSMIERLHLTRDEVEEAVAVLSRDTNIPVSVRNGVATFDMGGES